MNTRPTRVFDVHRGTEFGYVYLPLLDDDFAWLCRDGTGMCVIHIHGLSIPSYRREDENVYLIFDDAVDVLTDETTPYDVVTAEYFRTNYLPVFDDRKMEDHIPTDEPQEDPEVVDFATGVVARYLESLQNGVKVLSDTSIGVTERSLIGNLVIRELHDQMTDNVATVMDNVTREALVKALSFNQVTCLKASLDRGTLADIIADVLGE